MGDHDHALALLVEPGQGVQHVKDGVILGECDLGRYVHGDTQRHKKLDAFLQDMGW